MVFQRSDGKFWKWDGQRWLGLLLEYFGKLVREIRREQKPTVQPLLPGFTHLPVRILLPRGRRLRLTSATARDLERYVEVLEKEQERKGKNDPKLKEARKLRDRMKRRALKKPEITVGEALHLTEPQ